MDRIDVNDINITLSDSIILDSIPIFARELSLLWKNFLRFANNFLISNWSGESYHGLLIHLRFSYYWTKFSRLHFILGGDVFPFLFVIFVLLVKMQQMARTGDKVFACSVM